MMRHLKSVRTFCVVSLLTSTTTLSWAEADNEEAASPLAEVVVTAQKRAESIQSVPVSVSAISQKDIEERNVRTLNDLSEVAPSLSVRSQPNGRADIIMRGLGASGAQTDKPTESPSVGIYFDDVPVALALRSPDLRPVDLARIEVLRGPQGTLYGGGALGGAIKYVANRPDYARFGADALVDLNDTDHGGFGNNLSATLNLPLLTDKVAFRIVGYNALEPGFVHNVVTGLDHAGQTTVRGARAQLGFRPVDNVELIAKIIWQNSTYGPGAALVQRDSPSLPPGTLQGLELAFPTDGGGYDHFRLYNLTATVSFDFAELYSSTSRIDRHNYSNNDVSYLVQSLGPNLTFDAVEAVPDFETIQEVRLTSIGEGPLRWVVGGFYDDSHRQYNADGPSPGFSAATGIDLSPYGLSEPDDLYRARNDLREKQYALFGEAALDVGKLTFTAGARLFKQNQTYDLTTTGLFSGGLLNGETTAEARGLNPRFIVSYRQSKDVMVSAQVAKGFRLGGANDTIPIAFCQQDLDAIGLAGGPRSYGPENVWSYEINAKTRSDDGRLTFNPAIYYTRYRNVQLVQTLTNCGYNFVTNGASATTKGTEMDLSFAVTDQLTLRGGMSYTDAKLTSNVPNGVAGKDGDRLPFTPQWTGNLVLRYESPVGDWRAFGQVDVRYESDVVQAFGSGVDSVPAQTETGLRIGAGRNNLETSVYVDNLFDSQKYTSAGFIPTRGYTYTTLRPRQIGLTLSVRY